MFSKRADKTHLTSENEYKTFNITDLRFGDVTAGQSGKITFDTIPIEWNYPGSTGSLYMTLHELKTDIGIFHKEYDGGNSASYICVKLNENDVYDAKLIEILGQVEAGCLDEVLSKCCGKPQHGDKSTRRFPKATCLEHVQQKFEREVLVTDKEDPNCKVFFLKLKSYQYKNQRTGAMNESKCVFALPDDGKSTAEDSNMPWSSLTGKSFSFYPVIQIYRVFLGAQNAIQISLENAVISSEPIDAARDMGAPSVVRKAVALKNPLLASTMREKLANLKLNNQSNGPVTGAPAGWSKGEKIVINKPEFTMGANINVGDMTGEGSE